MRRAVRPAPAIGRPRAARGPRARCRGAAHRYACPDETDPTHTCSPRPDFNLGFGKISQLFRIDFTTRGQAESKMSLPPSSARRMGEPGMGGGGFADLYGIQKLILKEVPWPISSRCRGQ